MNATVPMLSRVQLHSHNLSTTDQTQTETKHFTIYPPYPIPYILLKIKCMFG